MSSRFDEIRLFSGNGNPALAHAICRRMNIPLGDATVTSFSNENIFVRLNESVREKDVFVVQSLAAPLSDRALAHAQHYAAKKMALMQALVETWLSAAALDEGAAASGGGGGGGGGASS